MYQWYEKIGSDNNYDFKDVSNVYVKNFQD